MSKIPVPAKTVPDYEKMDKKSKTPTKKVQPTVNLSVPKEALDGLVLGQDVTVIISGDVKSLEIRQSTDGEDNWKNRSELEISMDTVEIKTKTKDTKSNVPAEDPNPFPALVEED